MKKTLVALAALASISAFAQSTVTISGTLEYGAMQNGKTTTTTAAGVETQVKAEQTSQLNSWTTNQLSIQGTEDLGNGTKASFTVNTGMADGTLGNRDTFVALENAKMGKVQLGRLVTASALGFHGLSGSASTAVGSIYGLSSTASSAQYDRFGGATVMSAGSFERGDNKIQYTSPSFNGLTLNANYSKALSDSSAAAKTGEGKTTQTGFGLNYANGPMTLGFGTNTRKLDIEAAAAVTQTAGVLGSTAVSQSSGEGKLSWLAGSYNLGAATVYATRVQRKDTSTTLAGVETTNFDAKVNQFGVKVPMGQYTFSASTYSGKDKRTVAATDDMKLSGRQLSVQYAMSKRTSLYALTGVNKITRDATTGDNRKQTVSMVGLLHSF
jgi:predicted porin